MRNFTKALLFCLCLCLVFVGCTKEDQTNAGQESGALGGGIQNGSAETGTPVVEDFQKTDEEMFSDKDRLSEYDPAKCVVIELKGDTAEASSDSVRVINGTVMITEEANYLISGTLTNGRIVVKTSDEKAKPRLIFNGVNITSATSAALYVIEADKVFVTLAEGSENTLTNGGSFTVENEDNIDGAIFSKRDITLNGKGSLTVNSPAGHGIVAKDDLVLMGGTYQLNAASHGLDANDSIRIADVNLTVSSGKDGIHAENSEDTTLGFVYMSGGSLKLTTGGDGISASAILQIEDGTVELVSGGGAKASTKEHNDTMGGPMGGPMGGHPGMRTTAETTDVSTKGLKAGSGLLINGGSIEMNSADDGIHSNQNVTINGGSITVSTGDDGIHADEKLTITGGTLRIEESYEGLEATDILVMGGDIRLICTDDGLNAAGGTDESGMGGFYGGDQFGGMRPGMPSSSGKGSITVSGGTLYIQASGDGLDANGTLTISGGFTTVCGPTRGDTATMDYDSSGSITGGTFIGTGASGAMAQTFSSSDQGVISLSVGNQSAGTQITLKDSQGNVLLSHQPVLSFGVVILSSPDLVKGETYAITVGEVSGEFKAS